MATGGSADQGHPQISAGVSEKPTGFPPATRQQERAETLGRTGGLGSANHGGSS
jgi:hypothetical protein